ncbi:MAG: Holliday junction branch migration protein RuvA [bacterium]|nr:Holliday junction branch migration protein RuvA [bacterium]MBK9303117.1 Holliday junction branch migration protein RuvA [bacterium]
MIATLEGTLVRRGPDCLVEVGGLGLAVTVPAGCAAALPAAGERVRLWTHLAVREDAWTLYGFLDQDELALFRLLISVTGVGPKLALGILSGAPATTIAHALHAGDEKTLATLPGIGRKSAARLVVELGSRVPPALLAAGAPAPSASADADAVHPNEPVARDLLGAMGLPAARAGQLLREALREDADLGGDPVAWVRAALRHLG